MVNVAREEVRCPLVPSLNPRSKPEWRHSAMMLVLCSSCPSDAHRSKAGATFGDDMPSMSLFPLRDGDQPRTCAFVLLVGVPRTPMVCNIQRSTYSARALSRQASRRWMSHVKHQINYRTQLIQCGFLLCYPSPLAASVTHAPPRTGVCTVARRAIWSREERFRACESSRQGA